MAFGGLALNGTAIESFLQSGQTFFKVYSIERQIASRFDLPGCVTFHGTCCAERQCSEVSGSGAAASLVLPVIY